MCDYCRMYTHTHTHTHTKTGKKKHSWTPIFTAEFTGSAHEKNIKSFLGSTTIALRGKRRLWEQHGVIKQKVKGMRGDYYKWVNKFNLELISLKVLLPILYFLLIIFPFVSLLNLRICQDLWGNGIFCQYLHVHVTSQMESNS